MCLKASATGPLEDQPRPLHIPGAPGGTLAPLVDFEVLYTLVMSEEPPSNLCTLNAART